MRLRAGSEPDFDHAVPLGTLLIQSEVILEEIRFPEHPGILTSYAT
jgi:hypothetical protein